MKRAVVVGLLVMVAGVWATGAWAMGAANVPRMSTQTLKQMLDDPDVVLLDVRIDKEWKASEHKIKGAQRVDPAAFSTWAQRYPKDRKLVLY